MSIQKIRDRTGQLNALNEALKRAQEKLYAMNLGVQAQVKLGDGLGVLMWSKTRSKWGLTVVQDTEQKPLDHCSVETKKAAAYVLNDLLKDMHARRAADEVELEQAIAAAQAFLRRELEADAKKKADLVHLGLELLLASKGVVQPQARQMRFAKLKCAIDLACPEVVL